MTNNITLYKTGDTSTTVTVWTIKVEEDIAKNVSGFSIPKANPSDTSERKNIDLLDVKRVFTVTGYLKDYIDAGASVTAATQRTRLRGLKDARSVDFIYDATYVGSLVKIKFTENPTDETTSSIYDVTVQFMEGTNVVGVP